MIDRRELLARARERGLPLGMIEKDYVLGWVLYGLGRMPGLVFKGGTALAKVYFPKTWRLSEDLDFVTDSTAAWRSAAKKVPKALSAAAKESGIGLVVKNKHANPGYLQFRIQYSGPLGKNWLKVDVTPESPVLRPVLKPLSRSYSDYPDFEVKVEQLEEVLAQKLRALVERKKVRDYYDVWRMSGLDFNRKKAAGLFPRKLKVKGTGWHGLCDIFPPDLEDVLTGYWKNELGRLVHPVPDMRSVLRELRGRLKWLDQAKG